MNGKRTVSIERSADYLYQKAVQNAAQRRYFDAIELMRSAVDRDPSNRDYQIRLAEMYDEAGYTDKARRLLLDLLAEKGAPGRQFRRSGAHAENDPRDERGRG